MREMIQYFGFTQMPFGKELAPGQLYRHDGHTQAAARITWCIQTRGLAVVTGDAGTGKTVAARAAAAALDPARHTIIYLPDPAIGARGIHDHIVAALGAQPRFHTCSLIRQSAGALAAEVAERGKLPVLILDEAHLMSHQQLEAVRILTNADMDAAANLAVVLLGQPSLRHNMKLGVLAALDQRITVRYHLSGMPAADTAAYLRHHLSLAGRADPLFADDALAAIHDAARGKPREINNLARNALLAGYTERKNIIDHACIRAAITEASTDHKTP